MKTRTIVIILTLIITGVFSTNVCVAETCKDASIACKCICANGQEEIRPDQFRADTKCSGFLCMLGCVMTDSSSVQRKCAAIFRDNGKCNDYCKSKNSTAKVVCASKTGRTNDSVCSSPY